jgi:hypothetical protein
MMIYDGAAMVFTRLPEGQWRQQGEKPVGSGVTSLPQHAMWSRQRTAA